MTTITGFLKDQTGSYIPKDPSAVLTYTVEWSEWLPTSDTILSTTFTITPITGDPAGTALRVVSSGNTSTKSYAIIDRGTSGEIYTVAVFVITNNGNRDTRRFRIKVNERYA